MLNGIVFMVIGLIIISNRKSHHSVQLEEVAV